MTGITLQTLICTNVAHKNDRVREDWTSSSSAWVSAHLEKKRKQLKECHVYFGSGNGWIICGCVLKTLSLLIDLGHHTIQITPAHDKMVMLIC